MAKKFPIYPAHPERTCWGCDRYCAADAMICGNGSERTQHPAELFGEGWEREGLDPVRPQEPAPPAHDGSSSCANLDLRQTPEGVTPRH